MEHEWGPVKAKANLRKHLVSIADAAVALEDPRGRRIRIVYSRKAGRNERRAYESQ